MLNSSKPSPVHPTHLSSHNIENELLSYADKYTT